MNFKKILIIRLIFNKMNGNNYEIKNSQIFILFDYEDIIIFSINIFYLKNCFVYFIYKNKYFFKIILFFENFLLYFYNFI